VDEALGHALQSIINQGPMGAVAVVLALALAFIYVDQRREQRRRDGEIMAVVVENTAAMTSLRDAVLIQNTSRDELKATVTLNTTESRALREVVERVSSAGANQLDRIERVLDGRK
jgi:hypothetical protein